jgi:hypothetical protein
MIRNRWSKKYNGRGSIRIEPAVVDSLGGVLHLEDAAIWREGGNGQIVTCSYTAHCHLMLTSLRRYCNQNFNTMIRE